MSDSYLKNDIKKFCDALDMEYQVDFVRAYSKIGDSALYGGKHCGSDAEHKGAEFIAECLKEIGVPKVELIPCSTSRYQFNDATLSISGDDRIIKPFGYVSPGTDKAGIRAEVINAGKATRDEFSGIDAEGKIAIFAAMGTLEGGNLAGQMEEAVRNGAAAIIIYAVEDVLDDETIRVQPPNIISPVPIVGICRNDADYILDKLAAGKAVEAELAVDAEFIPDGGTTFNVVGEIPGRFSDEPIIYTAHLDHYFRCLQDNMASCATLLGIAKAMLDSGYAPNRPVIFAFHGSHETGGQDTRYPYIFGSYKLANEDRREWSGKAVVNINFEYTALRHESLHALAYLGCNKVAGKYFPYAPELVGGYEKKDRKESWDEYYMCSWSDAISYVNAGIPGVYNDPITDQLYEGKGEYIGRDHSNMDNWDIFSEKALEDIDRFFGGFGIYIDSEPFITIDFTEETNRIKAEVDPDALAKLGISPDGYMASVAALEAAAVKINRYTDEQNEKYRAGLAEGADDSYKAEWFEKAALFNKKILRAYKAMTEIDKINQFDFLCLGTVKYLQNIELMMKAAEYLKAGDHEKAVGECLASVDLCLSSNFFSEAVVEHMRKQICAPEYAERRTWARGRELHIFSHYDLMKAIREESEAGKGFEKSLGIIEKAVKNEVSFIPEVMAAEQCKIDEITEIITH